MNARGRRNLRAFDVYLRPSEEVHLYVPQGSLGAMSGKVHVAVYWLLFSCLVIARCGHIETHDSIDHSKFTAGEPVTADPVARGKEGIRKYWRWGYSKINKPDIIDLPRTIADDERWMKTFDVPRLHLILDSYLRTAEKTWWMGKIGRALHSRMLRSILSHQVRRLSSSIMGGPVDNEIEPRIETFWNLLPCYSSQTEPGLCLSTAICSAVGGRSSGSCMMGKTCCVINRIITACSANVVANNTYWQSPLFGVDSGSMCLMSLHLNTGVIQQNFRPICQIRLDFDIFSIAQPNAASVCDTDVFRVAGSVNSVPPICGDNARQHMYLTSTSTASNIQLIFKIGVAPSVDRAWRVKMSLLPCFVDYLAPPDFLQYVTSSAGTVKSFNWKDVAVSATATRQLADQDYKICFRTELLSNNQVPTTQCLTECSTTNGGLAFSLSRLANDLKSSAGGGGVAPANQCGADFMLYVGGFDANGAFNDRFCGNQLNPTPAVAASTITCSKLKNFQIRYVTNGDENGDSSNSGFCLNFLQF